MAELRAQLDGMARASSLLGAAVLREPDPAAAVSTRDRVDADPIEPPAEPGAPPGEPDRPRPSLFDYGALEAVGLPASDVDALRQRWERHELDKLHLNDRAMREGWFMTPRHRDAHRALDEAYRADLGEDGYEAYLYATGRPNRLAVREVLPGSAASAAGLAPGDQIVRYDGARIVSTRELQLASGAGQLGEPVSVEPLRDGRPETTVRIARGPLWVVFRPVHEAPASGR